MVNDMAATNDRMGQTRVGLTSNNPAAKVLGLLMILVGFSLSTVWAATDTHATVQVRDDFAERPAGVSTQQWEGLRAAVEQSVLRPSPEGSGGENSAFGFAVSLDGNRALVSGRALPGVSVLEEMGGSWTEVAVLVPSDGVLGDDFGISVSLLGDRALIGASADDDNGLNSGSAYIFEFDGNAWTETSKLTALDGASNTNFGFSVSLAPDRALIGAAFDNELGTLAGAAYIFDFDGANWAQTTKLTASDGAGFDRFGTSVSLDVNGNRALIGAVAGGAGGSPTGSAYVFDLVDDVWTESAELVANDAGNGDEFGTSVSLDGSIALIGARRNDAGGADSGAAYVFTLNDLGNWPQTGKLSPADNTGFEAFGTSVSLDGNRALVGATGGGSMDVVSGSAYVFDFDGVDWNETTELIGSDSSFNDQFGGAVSLSGNRALIGAESVDLNDSGMGAAYVFDFDSSVWSETEQLTGPDGSAIDLFGFSVSIENDRAIVGAQSDDDASANAGAVYVYDFNGLDWVETAKLTPSSANDDDRFGTAVSLSANRALIGATGDDTIASDAGAAYVFDFDGLNWVESAKLLPADGLAFSEFGNSVSLDGDRALVGAWLDSDVSNQAGSAYLFDFDGVAWTDSGKLTASDANDGDTFGTSVSLHGDRALIGAEGNDDNGPNSGSAYVFELVNDNWVESVNLTSSDAQMNDSFGQSVSVLGDRALIGAPDSQVNAIATGSAYVFEFNGLTWNQTAKLTASDGEESDSFGFSVSLAEDRALIGAVRDDDNGNSAGAAYLYDFNGSGWSETVKLLPSDGAEGDQFGHAVSLSGNTALIGAILDDDHGAQSGSAYVLLAAYTDLAIDKTSGSANASPGGSIEYLILVENLGPSDVVGAQVIDNPPPRLGNLSWMCQPTGGATCSASGTGPIDELVDIPVGESVAFMLSATLQDTDEQPVTNTASIEAPNTVVELDLFNNNDSDTDSVGLFADGFESAEPD